MGSRHDVIIAGGGFSGTCLLVRLLAVAPAGWSIGWIQPEARPGEGVAFSTLSPSHLLNVPASRMSALTEEPLHFLGWLQSRDSSFTADAFVPRSLYARYLRDLLEKALARPGCAGVERLASRLSRCRRSDGGIEAELADGTRLTAPQLVLALGHSLRKHPDDAPASHALPGGWIRDPWSSWQLPPGTRRVTLLGTGLTMVDTAISLEDRGFPGEIQALSRRGLLPRSHLPGRAPARAHSLFADTPSEAIHALRERIRSGVDWREAIDELRAQTPHLWACWTDSHRMSFIRHAIPYWDVHRHRLSPAVFERLQSMLGAGRLVVKKTRQFPRPDALAPGEVVIDCRSHYLGAAAENQGLVESLERELHASFAPLGWGVRADRGQIAPGLWTLGPPLRWELGETTSVPEIRSQAATLAAFLVRGTV